MGIGLTKIKHVKLPVSDLQRSVAWYQSLLDLELRTEFVEDGIIRGASLLDRDVGYEIALRNKDVCAGTTDAQGFDLFALSAPSKGRCSTTSQRGVIDSESSTAACTIFPASALGWISPTRTARLYPSSGMNPALPPFVGGASDKNGTAQPYFPPRLSSER
jgi:hypothetical protein